MARYQYPVTNKHEGRIVTEPDREEDLFEENLYVDFDEVRGEEFRESIFYALSIEDDRLAYLTDDYVKIICSGHRGCGKSTELQRLHRYLDAPPRYFSILLSIEQEMDYGTLEPEDIFVWIILKLVEAIKEHDIATGRADFDDLALQLVSDKTIERELSQTFATEASVEAGGGFDFLVRLKTIAKAVFSGKNSTSTKIREEVRKNTLAIIQKINAALVSLRTAVHAANRGQDLLFIIDGSEKLDFKVYEYLFITNPHLLRALAMNMIVAIPINAFYKIEAAPGLNFPKQFIVPMIKLGEPGSRANECFKKVITRRVDEDTFFAAGVLDECVRRSGGCMRQLLIIVNTVINKALGRQASLSQARAAIQKLGSEMSQVLSSEHVAVLDRGLASLKLGDTEVRDMLFRLILLKYNGHVKLNPLLEDFITIQ